MHGWFDMIGCDASNHRYRSRKGGVKEGKGMVEETGGITKPSQHSQEMSEHVVATMTDRLYLSHTCSLSVI